MKVVFSENEENKTLKEKVSKDTELKNIIVDYVGRKINPEDDNITTEMIVEIFAQEFPEFLIVVAEENFLRGYQQGIDDIESFADSDNEEFCGNPLTKVKPGIV